MRNLILLSFWRKETICNISMLWYIEFTEMYPNLSLFADFRECTGVSAYLAFDGASMWIWSHMGSC